MLKRILAAILVSATALFTLGGCGGGVSGGGVSGGGDGGNGGGDGSNGGGTKITVAGSSSVTPLIEKLKEAYESKNSTATIEIQQSDSTTGVNNTAEGVCDIGMSSRELKPDEISGGLTPLVIAYDGIAIIVNSNNPVGKLTADEIRDIYQGTKTKWSDFGYGDGGDINVITREEGSGTRSAFADLLKILDENKIDNITQSATVQNSTSSILTQVKSDPRAIGYISMGVLATADGITALEVDGVAPSVGTIKDKTYKVQRPFIVMTKGETAGQAKDFIDFIMSAEGQALVEKDGYVAVADATSDEQATSEQAETTVQ